MQKVTTFLAFKENGEEAVKLYVSLLKNSKILNIMRSETDGPIARGALMHASFVLDGQEYMAIDGGPHFTFSDGISLFVNCETQAEVDELWEKLSEGGEKGQCGWLKDKYGLSWQIVPTILGELIGDKDPRKAQNVVQAMLQMTKLDIQALQRAYEQ
jgi:predicted 3-demethylubiquinone-9 3-methyltransferase (glyoxalase superfamily)